MKGEFCLVCHGAFKSDGEQHICNECMSHVTDTPCSLSIGDGDMNLHLSFRSKRGRDAFLEAWPEIRAMLRSFTEHKTPYAEMCTKQTESLPFVPP